MKTGIVFDIAHGKAVIMKNNGDFIAINAQPNWKKGDLVPLRNTAARRRPFYAAAACLAMVVSLSCYGFYLYYDDTSLVSIDINPSIELSLNRFDRVIELTARNNESVNILKSLKVKNKKYSEALKLLIDSKAMSPYIENNSSFLFTVHSKDKAKENAIMENLENTADTVILDSHQSAAIEYYAVDRQFVSDAHSHGVTAGKYVALLQLQEAAPAIDITEYTHHSIADIQTETKKHQDGHHSSDEVNPNADYAEENNDANNDTHEEHKHNQGHK